VSPEEYRHIEPITVRWGDMDRMAHVNNAKYFTYCESARMSYFDAIRLYEHAEHEAHGPALVSATCNFLRQVRYPAKLAVGTRVSKIGRSTFTHEYLIWRQGSEEVVADGNAVVVWVDYAAGKSVSLPASVKAAIEELEGRRLD
jgi:acyl-CoA thioester hydrolase